MLVRNHSSVIQRILLTETIRRVQEKLARQNRISPIDAAEVSPIVAFRVALAANTEYDLKCGMVEGELSSELFLVFSFEVVLCLAEDLFKMSGLETCLFPPGPNET